MHLEGTFHYYPMFHIPNFLLHVASGGNTSSEWEMYRNNNTIVRDIDSFNRPGLPA